MRENTGEVELAKKGRKKLPELIGYDDLKGDLQVHSNSTDGTMSIEDMAFGSKRKVWIRIHCNNGSHKKLEINKWA